MTLSPEEQFESGVEPAGLEDIEAFAASLVDASAETSGAAMPLSDQDIAATSPAQASPSPRARSGVVQSKNAQEPIVATASANNVDAPVAESATPAPVKSPGSNAKAVSWHGKVLGHFKLEETLGHGGMGVVFKAEDLNLHRKVAVKVLRRRIVGTSESDRVEMFMREARAIAHLSHPNIVHVYEISQSKGWWYLAMEFLDGGTIHSLVKEQGPLTLVKACVAFSEAAQGLAEAHETGVIHRDVKPANLILTRKGRCKVADFGLVRFEDPNDLFHVNSRAVGTPQFVAPEVARRKQASGASDVYSLGASLFYALAGRPPYIGETRKAILEQHRSAPIPDIRQYNPGVTNGVAELLRQSLAKEPGDRPTATSFAGSLSEEFRSGMAASGVFDAATVLAMSATWSTSGTPEGTPASGIGEGSSGSLNMSLAPVAPSVQPNSTLAGSSPPAVVARPAKPWTTWAVVGGLTLVAMAVLASGFWKTEPIRPTHVNDPGIPVPGQGIDQAQAQAQAQALALAKDAATATKIRARQAETLAEQVTDPALAKAVDAVRQTLALGEQAFAQGKFDEARQAWEATEAAGRALERQSAAMQVAQRARDSALAAGKAAEQSGAGQDAVEKLGQARKIEADALAAYGAGEHDKAATLWSQAKTAYAKAGDHASAWSAANKIKAKVAAELDAANVSELETWAGVAWKELDSALKDAAKCVEQDRPAEAIEAYRKVSAGLVVAKQAARVAREDAQMAKAKALDAQVAALWAQAQILANPTDGKKAMSLLEQLLALRPEHPQAKELLAKVKDYYVRKPGDLSKNGIGMSLAYCPPGEFQMGSPPGEPGRKEFERLHAVRLTRGFHMGVTEVTQAQWDKVMGKDYVSPDGVHPNDATGNRFLGDDLPADGVSYNEAVDFCKRLSKSEGKTYRLPTEAEWEYACRAGSGGAFNLGEKISADDANIDGYEPYRDASRTQSRRKTLMVASFKPNAWGLYDMHGNAMEWTSTWFAPYAVGLVADPKGPGDAEAGPPETAMKVLRGGSWKHYAVQARAANRTPNSPALKANYIGFRVLMEDP